MRRPLPALKFAGLQLLLGLALSGMAMAPAHAADTDELQGLIDRLASRLDPQTQREETWMAISDNALDRLRGGFDIGGGLMVNFGITRAVIVNGSLVTETSINLGNVASLTPAQSAEFNRQLGALNLVQVGPGNSVEPQSGALGGTIIQNTLNNQRISNQTIINASSNAMSTVKNLNTMSTLADSLSRSVGGRLHEPTPEAPAAPPPRRGRTQRPAKPVPRAPTNMLRCARTGFMRCGSRVAR